MPYVINNTSGTKIFYVGDQSFNTETALTLPGRNVPDYGEPVDTNFIHLLENFANGTPPQSTVTLQGQLWYDTSDGIFKVYDGANWVQTGKVPVSELPPPGNQSDGNFYFDTSTKKLKLYYDNTWYDSSYAGEVSTSYNTIGQGSPSLYGARVRNIFLRRASDNRDVPCLAITQSYDGLDNIDIVNGTVPTLYGSETLIGLFSRNAEFVALDVSTNSEEESLNFWDELNQAGGIGTTIKPGLNVRKDATAEYPIASLAQRAQTSYNLNLGSYGADDANIAAANVFRHDSDSLPVANLTYDLGGPDNVFAEAWVDQIYLSNALLGNGSNVTIGTDDKPIENIYVTDIEIDGNLLIEGDVTIGSNTSPVAGIYVEDLYVEQTLSIGNVINETNYVFPDSRAGNSRLVCDDDGQLYWLDNGALFTNIVASSGMELTVTLDPLPGAINIVNRQADISAKIGLGLYFDQDDAIAINFNDISTCDIKEGIGCDRLYYSDARVFAMIEASVDPSNESGLEALNNGPDDYQLRIHGGASRVVGVVESTEGSPILIDQNRTNLDDFGFNKVGIELVLDPLYAGDQLNGIPANTGLDNEDNGLSLDWPAVADNLFDVDITTLSPADQGTVVGTLAIKRKLNDPTDPASHVIFIDKITKLGSGGESVEDIVYKNKENQMGVNSGSIVFGPTTTSSNYYWQAGYNNLESTNYNSLGTIQHKGDINIIGGSTSAPGNLVADGDVTARRVTQTSDERLKQNILPIQHGLDKVLKLQGVEYQYIADADNTEVGLIAQQVEEVVPEVVRESADGMKTVNYGALVGVLIEAVKELTQEVETLKAKLGD